MKGLHFSRIDAGTLYLTADVVRRLQAHRQLDPGSREAGGVLLGRHLLDSDDLIVDDLTEPSRGDRRSWASFFRSMGHQAKALARWHRSGGTCAYLGSWHTHPEPDPKPSGTDIGDWQHALARDRYEGDNLFFAIVGTVRMRVWQGTRRAQLEELHVSKERQVG